MQRIAKLREEYLDEIMSLIDRAFVEEAPEGSTLVDTGRYHMKTGGKRLRALFPLAVADALGTDPRDLVPFGAACEVLHNATLVHDDIQDGDEMRRNAPTVWKEFSEARAINLGDAMFYWAVLLVERLDAPAPLRSRAVQRLTRQTLRVIDGQELEFLLTENPSPTFEDYEEMVAGKTSALFSLTCAGAAELCGADDRLVEAIEASAVELGVLFQIQDDVLDLYGDKGRDQRGADLQEGKISAMVIHYLNNAETLAADELREILSRGRGAVTLDEVNQMASRFRREGSLQFALDEIERRAEAAVSQPAVAEHDALRGFFESIVDVILEPIEHVE